MMKREKFFAYGSLINVASLKWTAPAADNIFAAKVFGFSRSFCLPSSYRFDLKTNAPVCVLNVSRSSSDAVLNGICFDIAESDFESLREREKFYALEHVEIHDFYESETIEPGFLFRASGYQPYGYLAGSPEQHHYLQLCVRGCEIYGPEFVGKFRETTDFWGIDDDNNICDIWRGNY